MKFNVFLWLGASLAAVTAVPLLSSDLTSRDDGFVDLDVRTTTYDDVYSRGLDSHLYDRDAIPDLYERRIRGGMGGPGGGVGEQIGNFLSSVITNLKNEPKRQGKFTNELASKLCSLRPHHNWLIIKSQHKVHWDGVRGKDWNHKHFELPLGWFGRTSGFEIYYGKTGKLERIGDGGWQNWAMCGHFKRERDRFVTFLRP